jgi:hypothetical protein
METCCTIIADTGSPEEGLTSQNLRNKIKQPCGVAEVKGPINEACVKMLAKLLAYNHLQA